MYMFRYKVRYYNEIGNKYELAEGYVFGTDESETIEHLGKEYGADDIDKVELMAIDEVIAPIFETIGFSASARYKIEAEDEDKPW